MVTKNSKRSLAMPAECLTLGFAGYEAAGLVPPRETVWASHVADRLETVGCHVVTNMSGSMGSGLPDTMLHTNFGLIYLEFKGLDTPVRGNQANVANQFNMKSFYSRGELCCLVYRSPNILGILRPDKSVLELCRIDALSHPAQFTANIMMLAHPVVKGTTTAEVLAFITLAGMQQLPLVTYLVTNSHAMRVEIQRAKQCGKGVAIPYNDALLGGTSITENVIQTYSNGLALKQVTGLSTSSDFATNCGDDLSYEVTEGQLAIR